MTSAHLQAGLALILALGLHLGAFALRPGPAGASGNGAQGGGAVTLQAAGPAFADLVAAWDAPPAVPDMPAMEAPTTAESRPQPPAPTETRPSLPPVATATLAPPLAEAVPQADPPPSPPPPATRPQPRPAAKALTAPKPTPEPTPKPTPESTPELATQPRDSTAAQSAAGSGGGANAGTNGPAQAPSLSQGQVADLTASWGASIRARIEKRKRYPRAADGASGTVTVRLAVSRSGALTGLSIAASSGNPVLDEAALNAVRAAGAFAAAPGGLAEASYTFTLSMRFTR